MFEALGEWMGFPAYFTAYGGTPPPRSGAYHATIVPYGPFQAGDGGTVFLSVQNEREFARFCEIVLGKHGAGRGSALLLRRRRGCRTATPCTPKSSRCSPRLKTDEVDRAARSRPTSRTRA